MDNNNDNENDETPAEPPQPNSQLENIMTRIMDSLIPRNNSQRQMIHRNVDVLHNMGFSERLIIRSILNVDNPLDIEHVIEQCIFYDNMGTVPPELLRGTTLAEATFLGSRVTSNRRHMTYTVMEFDKENASVFLVPVMYHDSYMWGDEGSRKAFWAPMCSPDLSFENIVHNKQNPVWDETNCQWIELPSFTVSIDTLDATLQDTDWTRLKARQYNYGFILGSPILSDVCEMSKPDGDFSLKSFPSHLKPSLYRQSARRMAEVYRSHMRCICTVHGLSYTALIVARDDEDDESIMEMGHGLYDLHLKCMNSAEDYKNRYNDWYSRCLPFVKEDVTIDWEDKTATVTLKISNQGATDFASNSLRMRMASVLSRCFCPRLYKTLYNYNHNGHNSMFLTDKASKVTTKTLYPADMKMFLDSDAIKKLTFDQRRIMKFAVHRTTAEQRFGWFSCRLPNSEIFFHVTGSLLFSNSPDNVPRNIALTIDRKTPRGAIVVQPPKSGKSTVAAHYIFEIIARKYNLIPITSQCIVVVNKCPESFIDNARKFSPKYVEFEKWTNQTNQKFTEIMGKHQINEETHGVVFVISIAQLKKNCPYTWLWDTVVLDDAHLYCNNYAVTTSLMRLHRGSIIPTLIFTQNKDWKIREFNFYMVMCSMGGFRTGMLTFPKFLCRGTFGRYSYTSNLRKQIMRRLCIRDATMLQVGTNSITSFDVSTVIIKQSNNDVYSKFYEAQLKKISKRTTSVSAMLHAAATDISTIPVKELSSIRPEIINGVHIYKQRCEDACSTLKDDKESSREAKRKLEDISENTSSEEQCPICFDTIKTPVLLDCEHVFCNNCIKENARHSRNCPLCRKRIKIMKEIDKECPETVIIDGSIVEKKLAKEWEDLKQNAECPKVETLCNLAKKHGVVAFYSRFKVICDQVNTRLHGKSGTYKIFDIKSYKGYMKRRANIQTAMAVSQKWPVILMVYPTVVKSPVTIEDCHTIVANEPFLTTEEASQVMSRFISFGKRAPETIVLKTQGSIDTAGSYFRNNTESGLVQDFFFNKRISKVRKRNAEAIEVTV